MNNRTHIQHLKYEIEQLRQKLSSNNSPDIAPTIFILSQRIQELEEDKLVLDSTYPDGDGYWL